MRIFSRKLEETEQVAQTFVEGLSSGGAACVVTLQGDLGAGKTTFSQAVGRVLRVEENMHSPTFVIMKVYGIDYHGFKNLIHIDAYRLEKESELLHLGWEELIRESENLILIEWPENVSGLIPPSARRIFLKFIDESTREIAYED